MKKVFVGMSGGVDSSVSAALLKEAGYDVTGVFIKVWQPDWINCTWKDERRDAMRACAHLNIPFITLDLEAEYKHDVIDYMLNEYEKGRTPNPDVMCNKYVKFGAFMKWAMKNGAEYIATGHYARILIDSNSPTNSHHLLAGIDKNKDQSYFLWTLKQDDLSHILFPVGDLTKDKVRKLANKFGLPNSEKKDSQGLCFIGKIDVKDFLSHYIKSERGDVLNLSGEIIGYHPGSLFFTIGERHGFTIINKTPGDKPLFVVKKNTVQNTLTVADQDQVEKLRNNTADNANTICRISEVNWIRGKIPNFDANEVKFQLFARSRYRQELIMIKLITVNIADTTIQFEKPVLTLTPGQSLVIYEGEECIGGGIIQE